MDLPLFQVKVNFVVGQNPGELLGNGPHFQHFRHGTTSLKEKGGAAHPTAASSLPLSLLGLLERISYDNLSRDDLLLSLFHLVKYFLRDDVPGVRELGCTYTSVGNAKGPGAALQGALHSSLNHFVHGHVNPLNHRGEHFARCHVVLIRVYTDGIEVMAGCRIDDAAAGSTSCVVDDVGAALILADGQLTAAAGVVESTGVVHQHLSIKVGPFDAFFKTNLELADQGNFHTAHEAHDVGFGHHTCHNAYQEGTFMLFEEQGGYVRIVHNVVHNGEVDVGIIRGDLC